ncbi:MAG: protein FilA [Candidatus Acinetobacter avistercoris]|uniref:putative pilus system protein FilA n=1 Tax=Acinetobacter sp. KS-LM10 TaxID=3120518 RepID=UPI001FA1BCFB|nr:protein FilA [Candidatus Acinetobacter avistercoris]
MKLLTKLALVSSIAISANAMAMQAMDDESLSSTTGQDGISIGIKIDGGAITVGQLLIHDNDGLDDTALGGTTTAGAIVIGKGDATPGVKITQTDPSVNLLNLKLDTDAGTGTDGAFLNIAATVTGLKAEIGSIGVGASNVKTAGTVVRGTVEGNTVNEILTGLTLELGTVAANIQLGATPQGAMIALNSQIAGGLKLTNLGIKDNVGGGSIVLDSIQVVKTGQTFLDANAKIGVTTAGLSITPVAQDISAYIGGVRLGSAAASSIGDIEIKGLNMGASTITITGH